MGKRISTSTRRLVKELKGIVPADKNRRSCSQCFYYSSRKFCSKHQLLTNNDEICKEYSAKRIKIVRGGSTSPK
jgi:hypothetical protein